MGVAERSCGGAEVLVLPGEGAGGGGRDRAHVDLDLGQWARGIEVNEAAFDSVVGEDSEGCAGGVPMGFGCDVKGDAAEAVPAHFWARSIGVEDDHAGVGIGIGGDQEDSVGAYAVVAVAEVLDEALWEGIGGGLDQEEVVSQSVILRESLCHGGCLSLGLNAQSWRLGKGGVRIA